MKYKGDIVTEAILDAVHTDPKLQFSDRTVFWCWYRDSMDFVLSTSALATRSGISIDNIHRNLDRLKQSGWIFIKGVKQKRVSGRWTFKNTITPGHKLIALVEEVNKKMTDSVTMGQNDGYRGGHTMGQNDGHNPTIYRSKNLTMGQKDGRSVAPDAFAGAPPTSTTIKTSSEPSKEQQVSKGDNAVQHKETDEEFMRRRLAEESRRGRWWIDDRK